MFDGILRRKSFKAKCKSAVSRTRTRLEAIMRKRHAMQKFLKKDIGDLLKTNLGQVAYSRAEGLCIELNLSTCYDYVEECCKFVATHLKALNENRECPEECKVFVSSLIYGAARFADLPELRELRNQFNEKYSDSLSPYVSKEFVENLKSKPPTKEMKLQVMQEVAKEFAVTWDSMTLEPQLQNPSRPLHERGGFRSKSVTIEGKDENCNRIKEEDDAKSGSRIRHAHSCSHAIYKIEEQSDIQNLLTPETKTQQPHKPEKSDANISGFDRPRPKSVRTKHFRSSLSNVSSNSDQELDLKDTWTSRALKMVSPSNYDSDMSELPLPPGRRRYFSKSQPTSPYRKDDGRVNTESLVSSGKYFAGTERAQQFAHVHPRMPDFDELTERIAALKHV